MEKPKIQISRRAFYTDIICAVLCAFMMIVSLFFFGGEDELYDVIVFGIFLVVCIIDGIRNYIGLKAGVEVTENGIVVNYSEKFSRKSAQLSFAEIHSVYTEQKKREARFNIGSLVIVAKSGAVIRIRMAVTPGDYARWLNGVIRAKLAPKKEAAEEAK